MSAPELEPVLAALGRAQRIAIVSHRDPDPDTIGSGLALGAALEQLGKSVTLHCADPVPEHIRFLAGAERYERVPPAEDVDLVVTVDFGDAQRAKFTLPSRPPLANIDHHATNAGFGTANLVDVSAAATAELVSRVIDALGATWTPEMATAALVGIMTDTGSFQFPSTDSRALSRAALLRDAGADLEAITYNVFRNRRFEALRLWGFAFSRLRRESGGELVWSELRSDDLAAATAKSEDASGLIEQMARSSGARVTLLFNGETTGAVKISCRTSPFAPSVDASALMARFGGGGHVRAAGALVQGSLADVRDAVLAAARESLAAARVTA